MQLAPLWRHNFAQSSFNAARGFVGGAAIHSLFESLRFSRFNAARGFVGGAALRVVTCPARELRFNAARGFVGGAARLPRSYQRSTCGFQCRTRLCGWCSSIWRVMSSTTLIVSMPHAALWVVQPSWVQFASRAQLGFNAARGFVGGAASSLSALFPLGGKSTFGKSPEIREF